MHTPFCYDLKIVLKKRLEKFSLSFLGDEMRFPSSSPENEISSTPKAEGTGCSDGKFSGGKTFPEFCCSPLAHNVLSVRWCRVVLEKEGVCSLLLTT